MEFVGHESNAQGAHEDKECHEVPPLRTYVLIIYLKRDRTETKASCAVTVESLFFIDYGNE